MAETSVYPVILSGGAGTRLWPLSRAAYPKQLLALHGDQTMIQQVVSRSAVPGAAPAMIICGDEHRFLVAEQMRAIGAKLSAIILEPSGRNTASAAAIAALAVAQHDPKGVVLLLPSDHVVADQAAFEAAVEKAVTAARLGYVVAFGIEPATPETGYGYVQRGARIEGADGAFRIRRFTEKPDRKTAEGFIASGDYKWNSGMFVFRADVLLEELKKHAPDICKRCEEAFATADRDSDFTRLEKVAFEKSPSISLDYAVMEKTDMAALIPCTLGWNDIGAWGSLWDIQERDADGNVFSGDVLAHNVQNSFVRSEHGVTALIGVRDVVVVVTEDAVLVSDRQHSQDVKAVVDRLKAGKRSETIEHKTVRRPWGAYRGIDAGPGFQVKEITVNPGGRLSLQMHYKRAEHWVVVEGVARVTRDDEVFNLAENQSAFIPQGARHRLENLQGTPLKLIEIQYGSYLGEDDIVRFDDVYGRVASA